MSDKIRDLKKKFKISSETALWEILDEISGLFVAQKSSFFLKIAFFWLESKTKSQF